MNEHVAAPDFLQKAKLFGSVVEKSHKVEGEISLAGEDETEDPVLDDV